MNFDTQISAWISTNSHAKPLDSSFFAVFVRVIVAGEEIAYGIASRPFREMPYVTTDAELQETEFWKGMVEEAKDKAMQGAKKVLGALREPAA